MQIHFNKYAFKTKQQNQSTYIYDEVRKKYVILTAEEWVRQHFIHFLTRDLHYPIGKLAVEKEFKLHGRKKRFDLLVYDKEFQPFLLFEFKAQNESLNEQVAMQCLQYNMNYGAKYIIISNGDYTLGWDCRHIPSKPLHSIPEYVQ